MSFAHDVTAKKNIVSLNFSTNIITSITARPGLYHIESVVKTLSIRDPLHGLHSCCGLTQMTRHDAHI
jgi:hypothetical protein